MIYRRKIKTSGGFVALFMVSTIGLLASMFLVSTLPSAWFQAKEVSELNEVTQNRLLAISCLNIARLKLYLEELSIIGEYNFENGNCLVEDVRDHGNSHISITTSAFRNPDFKIVITSQINSRTLEIVSVDEI